MAFYKAPLRKNFETEEEYEAALERYEDAVEDYCEMYREEQWQTSKQSRSDVVQDFVEIT